MVHTQTLLPEHSLLCASYSPKSLPWGSWDSFWLPGYQVSALVWIKKNMGATWHCPHLWLQIGRPLGGAAGSNAILLKVHFASVSSPCRPRAQGLRHGAPASNGEGPSAYSPYT